MEAFKSTLEEAASADVLLCVCDASSPEMDEQIEVTTSLLAELGAADTPMIKVLNKCDLVPGLRPLDRKDTVLISARERPALRSCSRRSWRRWSPPRSG